LLQFQTLAYPKMAAGKPWWDDYSLLLEEAGILNGIRYASCSESFGFGDGPSSPPLFVAIQVPRFHRLKTGESLLVFADVKIINHAVGLLDGKEDLQAMRLTSHMRPGLHKSSFSILRKELCVADSGFHFFLSLDRPRPLKASQFANSLQRNDAGLLVAVKVLAATHHSLSHVFDPHFTPIKIPAGAISSKTTPLNMFANRTYSSNRFSAFSTQTNDSKDDICERNSDAGMPILFPDFRRPIAPSIESSLVGVDLCRPDDSREALFEEKLRKPLIQLPVLSDSESKTESDCESSSQISLDAGYIGSLVEDPVPGEDEDLEFNERTRTFDTKPSIVSLFACPSGFPGRLYSVVCGYAANVSDKTWQEFVDIAAQHGYLMGAGTALNIEQESNILSSLWAYHVQLNHSSPAAMLGLLQRRLPSGLLLPQAIRDAVLGQNCEHCEKLNRGRDLLRQ
jgi:hypothetical protein